MTKIADMLQVCMGKKGRYLRIVMFAVMPVACVKQKKKKSENMKTNAQTSLRLGKLLLAEEEQETSTDQKLTEQGHPEPGIA